MNSIYERFNDTRPVKSFDFDGVLSASVINTVPISFGEPEKWKPFTKMIEHVREESKTHRCVVVTARDDYNRPELLKFIEIHNIPIEEVFCTSDEPKLDILQKIKAVAHYDDRLSVGDELVNSGIEFWYVNTENETWEYMWE